MRRTADVARVAGRDLKLLVPAPPFLSLECVETLFDFLETSKSVLLLTPLSPLNPLEDALPDRLSSKLL